MVFRSAFSLALLVLSSLGIAQGQTPTKEYIYLGGRVVAIENPPAAAITVSVTPASTTLVSGGTAQFSANVTGTPNTAVTWSVIEAGGGSITTDGVYTAPTVGSTSVFTVRATSQADASQWSTASVTVNPIVSVSVTPSSTTLTSGGTAQFSASVTGTTNTAVTWSIDQWSSGGTITTGGLYTAPTVGSTSVFTVRATSQADSSKSGTASVTVNPPAPVCSVSVSPATATIYSGREGSFSATTANCGAAGVTWSLISGGGALTPNGLTVQYKAPQGVTSSQTATVRASVNGYAAVADVAVTIQPSQPPVLISASPSSGTGTRQKFTLTMSDPQGQDDISDVQAVFLSDWAYYCQVFFNAQFDLLNLQADGGTWSSQPLGAAQTLTNSRCTVYPATSSVVRSGNQLALTVDLEFKAIFAGAKRVEVAVSDFSGHIVGYQQLGTWLVPAMPGTSQSSLVSISAPSIVAPGQSFQATVVLKNTGQNIWQSSALNPAQPHWLGSSNPIDNTTWGPGRVAANASQILPGQDATFVINATAPTTPGARSFSWRMVHDAVEWFGATASTTINVSNTESPHPYGNNLDQTWTYTYGGSCASLNVTFDSQTHVQSGDWLYVMDGNYSQVGGSPFTGYSLAGQTISVPGSTVRVRLTSDGSGTSWGFRMTNMTCIQAAPGTGFYDDADSRISYSSGWYHDTQFSEPLNATISYSEATNANVEFTFSGTGITYYYTKAFNRGYAYVYIDGQFRGTIDLYSSAIEWQQSAYFGGLGPGNHTIQIYVAGSKQSASQGYWVDLDGFYVH